MRNTAGYWSFKGIMLLTRKRNLKCLVFPDTRFHPNFTLCLLSSQSVCMAYQRNMWRALNLPLKFALSDIYSPCKLWELWKPLRLQHLKTKPFKADRKRVTVIREASLKVNLTLWPDSRYFVYLCQTAILCLCSSVDCIRIEGFMRFTRGLHRDTDRWQAPAILRYLNQSVTELQVNRYV